MTPKKILFISIFTFTFYIVVDFVHDAIDDKFGAVENSILLHTAISLTVGVIFFLSFKIYKKFF